MAEPERRFTATEMWQNVKAFAAYYKPFKALAAADAAAILTQASLTILLPMVVYRVFNDYLPKMELKSLLAASALLLVLTLLIGLMFLSLLLLCRAMQLEKAWAGVASVCFGLFLLGIS